MIELSGDGLKVDTGGEVALFGVIYRADLQVRGRSIVFRVVPIGLVEDDENEEE